jgi:hypothetical protein
MTEPTEPSTEDVVRSDLDLVVGGRFNIDEIGPQAYDEILGRLRANPEAYLSAVESRYLGANFDALTQSRLHVPKLFELLKDSSPSVRQIADAMLRHYDAALVIYDQVESRDALRQVLPEETVNLLIRLDDRRRALGALVEAED